MNLLLPNIISALTGTIILVLVYYYLYSSYRERFLLLWSYSWLIYALRFVFEIINISHPSGLLITFAGLATLASGILLLHGTYSMAARPMHKAWTALFIAGSAWMIVSEILGAPRIYVNAPIFTILAVIYIITGTTIIDRLKGNGKSAILTGTCFILWGIHKADYPFLRGVEWFAPWGFFIGTIFEFTAAIGLLMTFFEIQQKKLKKSVNAFNAIINATKESIFIHDSDTGLITDVNKTATAMFGYDKEELIGSDVGKISAGYGPYSPKDAWKRIIKTIQEGKQAFEWLCKRKDGSVFWVEVTLSKFITCESKAVLAVVRDITERKAADQAFEHSTNSLRMFFEEGSLLFLALDKEGMVTFANKRFADMTGWKSDEIAGSDLFARFMPDQQDALNFFKATVSDEGAYDSSIRENLIQTRTGEKRLVRWNCAPAYDSQARCYGAVIIGEDLTEHRREEDEKEFRNVLLTTEMETSIDGILIVDSDAKIVMYNQRFSEIWEIPEEILSSGSDNAAIGHVLTKLEDPERFLERIRYLYANPNEKSSEEIRLKDGRILDRYSAPMIGKEGRYFGRAWYFRDITSLKNAEKTLREREEQLKGIADNIPGGIYQFYARPNCDIGIIYVSERSEQIIGIPTDPIETYYERFKACVAKEFRDEFLSSIEKAINEKKEWQFEGKLVHPDGKELWITGNSIPFEKDGITIFNGLLLDITARKNAEIALKENEEKFRALFENMTEGVALHEIIYNKHGKPEDYRILDINPAYKRHIGIKSETLIGERASKVYQSDPPLYLKEFATVAEGGSPYSFETYYAPLDKHFSVSVFSPRKGQFASVFEDISRRKKDESDRLEIERKMLHVQKLESLGVLAGGIAHDFNNILTAILGHADIALIKLPEISPAKESLAEIERAARRASDLCLQMLAYSGRGKFVLQNINLEHLITEMVHLLKASISKKISLSIENEKNLPYLKGDATQIRQVLMNLITNASDAIAENTGSISIITASMYCSEDFLAQVSIGEKLIEGRYVILEVRDDGCGMNPDTMNRIFEPFFTTKFTGRGLGMAAVLGIVKGHHGGISIKSAPGEGTTFKIFLPVSDLGEEKAVTDNKEVIKKEREGLALIVDDEETVRSVASEMLELLGFEAITAEDGLQAIKKYRELHQRIDFVLLDLTMPGLSGEETLNEMKKINPEVKIIITSGYSESEISERFSDTGISGFIQKPFKTKSLSDKINEILD